jgi:hypothetical protein
MRFDKALLAAAVLIVGDPVNADVLDFEDVAVPRGTISNAGDIVSRGFFFDSTNNHLHPANFAFLDEVDSGSTYLAIHDFDPGNNLRITRVGGGTFGLNSARLAETFTASSGSRLFNATSIKVDGSLLGGGVISLTVALDGIADGAGGAADFQLATFPGWSNLESVLFSGVGGDERSWTIDDINVTIPEPMSLGLAGWGLSALVFRGRRRGPWGL